MSRNGSIIYQITNQLNQKCRFSESRHEHKILGDANKYIFSFNTLKTYQKQLGYMVKWAKENNIKLRNLEDIKVTGKTWLEDCLNKGMSPWTLTTRRAALCKLLELPYSYFDVNIPPRTRASVKRGRNKDLNRHFSEELNKEQVTFCKCTGLRLSELKRIEGTSLFFDKGIPYIKITKGTKGGKERIAMICGTQEEIRVCLNLLKTAGNGRVFSNVKTNANTHGYRAIYAKRIYEHFERPISSITDRTEIMFCRKDKKGIKYDKRALEITSKYLGHNRLTLPALSYLIE